MFAGIGNLWLRLRYSRSANCKIFFAFLSLIRIFARYKNLFAMDILAFIFFLLFVFIVSVILLIQMSNVVSQVKAENKKLSDLIRRLEPVIRKLADNDELQEESNSPSPEPELAPKPDTEVNPAPVFQKPVSPTVPEMPRAAHTENPKPKKHRRRNMEKIIGENLMSKIGILALIIGIGFFVKFAIDNDWINEVGRTVIGLATGIGLWGVAYPIRERYRSFSSVLAGGGFAICFVTVAVAYNFYGLFGNGTAFGIFVALTAAMIGISLRFDRRELAMTGFVGGFVAPFLAVGNTSSCIMLFGYITVLNAGIFLITMKRNWWELSAVGCILTWIIIAIYRLWEDLAATDSAIMLGFATLFVAMFSLPLATVLSRESRRPPLFLLMLISAAVNFFSYLLLGLAFIDCVPLLCRIRGIIPFIAGSINLVLFYRFYRRGSDKLMQNLLLGASAVFATLVIPLQFSDPSVTAVGFAVLTLAFASVYALTCRRLFAYAAAVLAFINVMRVLLPGYPFSIDAGYDYSSVWTYTLSGICYIGISWVISRKWDVFMKLGDSTPRGAYCLSLWAGVVMMCVAAHLLTGIVFGPSEAMTSIMTAAMATLLLVSLYGHNSGYAGWMFPGAGALLFLICCGYYRPVTVANEILQWTGALLYVAVMAIQGNRIFRYRLLLGPFKSNGFAIYFSLSASVFTVTAIELILRSVDLARYYSAGFSIGLIICGAMLMAAGMRYRRRVVRMAGLGIFGLLLLKLVVYDIWSLPMIGRIVVFILLGAVLLALSFLYQRLRKSIFGEDDRTTES